MKQTSIEWLIEKHFGSIASCTPNFRKKIEQAKEMHKQEIIDAYHKGCADQLRVYPDAEYNPEQYYSETYNK